MTEMLFEYRDVSYEVGNEHRAIVKIAKMESPSYAKIDCIITRDTFDEYSHLIDQYKCDSFSANTLSLELLDYLNDKNRYLELRLTFEKSGDLPIAAQKDFEIFHEFPNIKYFYTYNGIPKFQLQSYFPNLEALDISSWGKNKIAYKEGSWPNLKFLQVFNISDLKPLVGWDLQTLFLHSPRIDDLEELKHFPNLKTLMISGTGKSFDLSPLSHLKKLENLQIESRKAPIWRAVDQDGYVLDEIVQTRRNTKAAKRLLKRLLKKQGLAPKRMITDKLGSYGAAKRQIMPGVEHRSHITALWGLNNRAENSHVPLRKRERMMQGFRSAGSLQRFVSIFSALRNLFVPPHTNRPLFKLTCIG